MPQELYGLLPGAEYQMLKSRVDNEFRSIADTSIRLNPFRFALYGLQGCNIAAVVVMAIVDVFLLNERSVALYVAEGCAVVLGTGLMAFGLFYLNKLLTREALQTESRLQQLLSQQIGSCPMTFKLTVEARARFPPIYGIVAVPMQMPFASACPDHLPDMLPNMVETKAGANFC